MDKEQLDAMGQSMYSISHYSNWLLAAERRRREIRGLLWELSEKDVEEDALIRALEECAGAEIIRCTRLLEVHRTFQQHFYENTITEFPSIICCYYTNLDGNIVALVRQGTSIPQSFVPTFATDVGIAKRKKVRKRATLKTDLEHEKVDYDDNLDSDQQSISWWDSLDVE